MKRAGSLGIVSPLGESQEATLKLPPAFSYVGITMKLILNVPLKACEA